MMSHQHKYIHKAHGTGGRSTHALIKDVFHVHLHNELLSPDDAATLPWKKSSSMIVTTDAHVVEPIIFPGGDIGKLAVTGVVNDLVTKGARPMFMAATFILDEGLALSELEIVVRSFAGQLKENSIQLVCADTKVVPARGQPGLMISSTLWGEPLSDFTPSGLRAGDRLIVTADLGSHGLALLSAREQLPFQTQFLSDCNSLLPLLTPLFMELSGGVRALRDVTRGGLAGILHEWHQQHGVGFELSENLLPIRSDVRAGLELLGIDPLEVANEGVMLLAVAPTHADQILTNIRRHRLGQNAAIIGEVLADQRYPLVLKTAIGGKRPVPWPEALSLPRIC